MRGASLAILLLFALSGIAFSNRDVGEDVIRLPTEASRFFRKDDGDYESAAGTRWAVLIAGSKDYWNYRHQADVCHAYQLLRKGGLKEEHIVVFMYDDIAYNDDNPRKGIIVNGPNGKDVYKGVPKDYTGEDVNVNNFLAVLLANRTALTGGSGKVLDSGPDDYIFIFYSDHGGPGVLGMPTDANLYAIDLINVLKTMHASATYKSLVCYLEACDSGSIFEGLLPKDLNIYATTAANGTENSWATYCPGDVVSPPPEYSTCLGDLYSVSWMEDSEVHNLQNETLHQQYLLVKTRTAGVINDYGSHVMQYGDLGLSRETLFTFMGSDPANDNYSFAVANSLRPPSKAVNQRDADLIHFWETYRKSPEGSPMKVKAQKQLGEVISHNMHIDRSIKLIGRLLFGLEEESEVLSLVRPAGLPLVDDWDCLKRMVRTFESYCGSMSQYGMKHMRSIANICNAGIKEDQMAEASAQACPTFPSSPWSSLHRGFSA